MIRRFGAPPRRAQDYRRRAGVYAILMRGERVLLTFQSAPVPELQLPGGGIDAHESPLHALHREVLEETGWGIAAPRRVGVFRRFTYMPDYALWAEKLCTVFLARPTRVLAPVREPHHRACWLTLDAAIAQLGNDGDRHFLGRLRG